MTDGDHNELAKDKEEVVTHELTVSLETAS